MNKNSTNYMEFQKNAHFIDKNNDRRPSSIDKVKELL